MQVIEIFRPGTHTAMSGETIGFTEAQLAAAAAAYDPSIHEAPIVIGHPSDDGPAYGWVKKLTFAQSLQAEPDQIDPQFAELVQAGRYKKVSAAFYRPDSPNNPVPGVYYLRHVGFLGAQPPAVKGLRQVEFADAQSDIVELEFGEARGGMVQRLFRGLRDFLIGKEGLETADRVLPDWAIQDVVQEDDKPVPAFVETPASKTNPTTTTQEVTDVDKQQLEKERLALQEREQRIKEQEAAFAERERKERAADGERLVDELVAAGRVLPRHRDGLVAFMASAEADQPLQFGEGASQTKTSARDFLTGFLKDLPESVNYGEVSGANKGEPGEAPAVRVPHGYEVDPDKVRVHQKALAYQERNQCDYITAVQAVQRGGN